jgi:cell shape-determining protein MreC
MPPGYYMIFPLIAVMYILVIVVFLKLFRIIPDPPEMLDTTSIVINVVVTLAASGMTLFATFLRSMFKRLDDLEETAQRTETELKHMRDYLDLSTRIAKLEAKAK